MNKKLLLRVFKYAGKYKGLIYGSILCAVISVTTSLIGPILIGRSIDYMTGKGLVNFSSIAKILLMLAAVYAIGSLCSWLLFYMTNRMAYCTANDLRHQLFEKLGVLPLKFYDGHPHGDVISRFVNDMDAVSDGMLQGAAALITGVFTIAGTVGFMFYISPIMAAAVILSAPISYFAARFITTRSQQMFREQAKSLGKLNGYIEEFIGGQKVVKAFNYEDRSFEQFSSINRELYNSGVKSQFYGSLANPSTRLVNNITYSVIGVIGSITAILGRITIGDISSFLIYSNLFAKPFNEITSVITQIQSALASAQRIFQVLDEEPEKPDTPEAVSLDKCLGHVVFDRVSFSYTPDHPLINNFNLDVKPGTKIAIVGHTGAGKTTIVNLLMRFYDVDSGSISIDGTCIKNITRDSLRRSFGMVLQDTWLFDGTIKDNISYGKDGAAADEIISAAKAAGAHSFIRRLPHGYETLVTDGGENLSQGQRQLLTISRVMLVDPPMLILDEATSSIDTRTEMYIQKAFLKMLEGRTSFIIAHRLSTIREADLILVMDNGNIVETGTHDELLKIGGHYAKLYNSQFA